MSFNSLQYLIFLPLVVILFYRVPHKYRWILLLAASYYFYMCWKVEYALLIMLSTGIDYYASLKMAEKPDKKARRPYLAISLLGNLGLLFMFKYYDFFAYNLNVVLDQFNLFAGLPYFELLLPVGISFYTFQTLSYTLDVYNDRTPPERHFGYFAVYVSYFPQLVAGPIERSSRLIPQLRANPPLAKDDVRYAVNKILLGFAKKVVVADTLALYVNEVYGNIGGATGTQLFLASFFFGVQIFCDFSGYTDIAIGSARLMGVRLMENFKRPYWTMGVAELWSKWHISLTTWIRDYLYVPLLEAGPGKGKNQAWQALVAVIVMVAIGFWHGARWTFVFFGLYHSFFLLSQRALSFLPFFKKIKQYSYVRVGYKLFNVVISVLALVFFRSPNMDDAWRIFRKIFTKFSLRPDDFLFAYKFDLMMATGLSLLLLLTLLFNEELRFKRNWLYISTMIGIILLLGQDSHTQFIYFQF